MVFSSLSFLYFFLPPVIILYFIGRNRRFRNGVLLAASLIFYSWGEPKLLILMLLSSLVAYLCGLGIDRYRDDEKRKKLFLLLSLIFLIGSLVVFKYLNFFCDNIAALTGLDIRIRKIALPIGISFYTFQILSYVIDLYRGKVAVQKSFARFTLYVSFFPQLIAGPIVRYETVESEMAQRHENLDEAIYGARRFVVGLAKKVLLANNVSMVAEQIYGAGGMAGTGGLWLAALCYSMQLYFDFSGYSDMAIGLGRIFGFHFLENFNYHFLANSVTDYWRRWHISLSSWFRDYVYIPLGGSRVSRGRWIFNIFAVWGLTGLWHGAEWNFILWGLFYAVILILEKLYIGKLLPKLPGILQHAYGLFFIMFGNAIFYQTEISRLPHILKTMLVYAPTDWLGLYLLDTSVTLPLLLCIPALIFSFPVLKNIKAPRPGTVQSAALDLLYMGLLGVSILFIISSSYNPFIYFRF